MGKLLDEKLEENKVEWRRLYYDALNRALKAEKKAEKMMTALALIASPARPDGTWNRDRKACEILATETLKEINE